MSAKTYTISQVAKRLNITRGKILYHIKNYDILPPKNKNARFTAGKYANYKWRFFTEADIKKLDEYFKNN